MTKLRNLPYGFQVMLIYFTWIFLLGILALICINHSYTLLGVIIKWLLLASNVIGITFGLLLIIAVLYVAVTREKAKGYAIRKQNKEADVRYPIPNMNWCSYIANCLANPKNSKTEKCDTGKPRNGTCYKQESLHLEASSLLRKLCHILRLPNKGSN